jgi:outer membrane protein assembly factor BamB
MTVHGEYVHVFSECDSTTVSNLSCQGGNDGIDTTLYGIDGRGDVRWTRDATGFAVSQDDSVRTQMTSSWFDHLFTLDGEDNHTVSRIDPRTGNSSWSVRVDAESFELSRTSNGLSVPIYFSEGADSETTTFSFLDMLTGSVSVSLEISGDDERLDGATALTGFLIDDPDRAAHADDIESGNTSTAESEDEQSEDEIRTCVRGIDLASVRELWIEDCNQRQSVVKVGGYWLLVDRTSGGEEFFPLAVEEVAS